jgi:polyhydroxybutyrate depolymerase
VWRDVRRERGIVMQRRCSTLILTLFVVFIGFAPMEYHASETKSSLSSLTYDDITRDYYLVTPSDYDSSQSYPLLVVLNSQNTSGMAMAIMTGLNRLADTMGWLVVFADHSGYFWDDGRVMAGLPPYGTPVNESGYIGALIEHLGETHNARQDEVYLLGYRGSGGMAYQLTCRMPARFKGVAVVSALMFEFQTENCISEGHHTDMLIIHSATDSIFYMEGNEYISYLDRDERQFATLRPDETFAFWLAMNNCSSQAVRYSTSDVIMSQNCDENTRIAYVNIPNGGDSWIRMGAYRINQFGVDMTSIIEAFFQERDDWYTLAVTPDSDELARSYTLYVPPSYDGSEAVPLLVMLHMRPGDGASTAYITDMNRIAREEGFVVVYPDGLDNSWNYLYGFDFDMEDGDHDDGDFIMSLIDDLRVDLNLDVNRTYLAGISRGGFMTMRMACEYPDTFAAVASVSASVFPGLPDLCNDVYAPTPIILFHGTDDDDIEFMGSEDAVRNDRGNVYDFSFYSALETANFWADYNGCQTRDTSAIPTTGLSPETSVQRIAYGDCRHGADVHFYTIIGGGHNWPGVRDRLPQRFYGNVTLDVNASEEIWHFFQQYTLEERLASPQD